MLPEPLGYHQGTFLFSVPFPTLSFLCSNITHFLQVTLPKTKGCWEVSSLSHLKQRPKFLCGQVSFTQSMFSVLLSSSWYLLNTCSGSSLSEGSIRSPTPKNSPQEEKGKKDRGEAGVKGQEISVINRRHPVNFTHMSLCDTYTQ